MKISSIIIFTIACLSLSACATNRHYNAPQGGISVFPNQPIWLPGTKQPELEYTQSFPQAEKTDNIEVINAGFWIGNMDGKINQLIYEFTLNIKRNRNETLYSRVTLQLPDAVEPAIYHSMLHPDAGSSKVTHGPVNKVQPGESYILTYELFWDQELTKLSDKIEQKIVALAGNTSGCIELNQYYHRESPMLLAAAESKNIPVEKVVIACNP